MRRSYRLMIALAVCAILVASTAQAATQLLQVAPFKYRGHWVFNTALGSTVTILVQNTGATARQVTIEFAAPPLKPDIANPSYKQSTVDVLQPGQISSYNFQFPVQLQSLSFIRIRPTTI